jgi:uncharacterized membrane protein
VQRVRFQYAHKIRTSLWLVPFACALAGIVLSIATVWIDHTLGDVVPRTITGDPNAALMILSTVAASMVSLTTLVLTITSVVVQLAMGQFSPRSVRPFLQDRPSQLAIGIFVGTFAHAMFAMRDVRSFTNVGSVPGVTIVTSYLLVFVSVVVLVAYVHHIANSLKVDAIIDSVGQETRQVFERLYPRSAEIPVDPWHILSDKVGFVLRFDHEALVELASQADVRLRSIRRVGEFVPEGSPLFDVEAAQRSARAVDAASVRQAVAIGRERAMQDDAVYGVQTLVDIAERALSEDFGDQTTAAQVVDRLHDLLRALARRTLASGRFEDADGTTRLIVPEPSWDDYVALAFDDIKVAGAGSPVVMRRLRAVLEDLVEFVPDERKPPLQQRLDAWELAEMGRKDPEPESQDPAA